MAGIGVFTPLERNVLEYAEAMTNTPTTLTDELSASLLERLGQAALVQLTVFIGFANLASRVNTAHGITSQGYSDACEIPLVKHPEKSGVASPAYREPGTPNRQVSLRTTSSEPGNDAAVLLRA